MATAYDVLASSIFNAGYWPLNDFQNTAVGGSSLYEDVNLPIPVSVQTRVPGPFYGSYGMSFLHAQQGLISTEPPQFNFPGSDFSVACLFSPQTTPGTVVLVSKDSTASPNRFFELITLGGGYAGMDIDGVGAVRSASGVLTAGKWYLLIGVYTASTQLTSIYLTPYGGSTTAYNGTATATPNPTTLQPLVIGARGPSGNLLPFNGAIASVGMANYALSSTQISALATAMNTVQKPAYDTWRYRFYLMQNGQTGYTSEQHLFDLPINSVQFSTRLNNVGQLQGNIQLSDSTVQEALKGQPSLNMLCERTALYVDLNGTLVWGGILQQAKYQRTQYSVQIIAQDWWGYFLNSRLISWNSSYTNVDQLAVAADLINVAQGAGSTLNSPAIPAGYCVGGNVGVALGATAAGALSGSVTSGVEVSAVYPQSAFKQVGQAISDIGTAANGFDWTIDVAYDGSGVPTKTFNIWYPRAGTSQANGSTVTFNLAGTSGVDYIWTTGQTQAANVAFAAGSGSGNTAIAAEASNSALWTAGWPLMEDSISFTDVTDQNLLDQMALAYLNQTMYPVSQPEPYYACGVDSDQPLGTYQIGDDCRVIIDSDGFFPGGYDSSGSNTAYGEQWWRIVQWTVNVQDDGKSYNDIVMSTPVIL